MIRFPEREVICDAQSNFIGSSAADRALCGELPFAAGSSGPNLKMCCAYLLRAAFLFLNARLPRLLSSQFTNMLDCLYHTA